MKISDNEKSVEVMKALGNDYCRRILISTMSKSLSVLEIAEETHLPISSCYRRVHNLETYGLVRKDKTIISEDGKKYVRYISTVKDARINFDSEKLVVDVGLNGNLEHESLILGPQIIS